MTTGNITRRGARSWRIKFDLPRDPISGERRTYLATVRGTKKEAQAEMTRKLAEMHDGSIVTRSATTVLEYARHWLAVIAPSRTSAKTRERYAEIIELHIGPQIGSIAVQKLDGARIDAFYTHLLTAGRRNGKGGLAAQTVQHVHRLLSKILSSGVKAQKLRLSPMAAVQTTPKVRRTEIQVLDDAELAALFRRLRDRPLRMPVVLAAGTGMRRGEVLALRWRDVDFAKATLQVAQVVEQTKKGGITIKEPKTERSRRTIALPATLVTELREHRRGQAEFRLKLGLGRDERDLVFPSLDWTVRSPRDFTKQFGREAAAAGVPHVTFHGLRHTHITHLLRSGVPVHVVSARAGHANPTVTLNIYAHLLPGQQEGAAAVFDATLRRALEE